jgi:hypothetical protein
VIHVSRVLDYSPTVEVCAVSNRDVDIVGVRCERVVAIYLRISKLVLARDLDLLLVLIREGAPQRVSDGIGEVGDTKPLAGSATHMREV